MSTGGAQSPIHHEWWNTLLPILNSLYANHSSQIGLQGANGINQLPIAALPTLMAISTSCTMSKLVSCDFPLIKCMLDALCHLLVLGLPGEGFQGDWDHDPTEDCSQSSCTPWCLGWHLPSKWGETLQSKLGFLFLKAKLGWTNSWNSHFTDVAHLEHHLQ